MKKVSLVRQSNQFNCLNVPFSTEQKKEKNAVVQAQAQYVQVKSIKDLVQTIQFLIEAWEHNNKEQ